MKVKALLKKMGLGLPVVVALSAPAAVFAHSLADGDQSRANIRLSSSNNWVQLKRVSFTIPASDNATHDCVVTASADMALEGNAVNNRYRFAVSHNNTQITTDSNSERTVETSDNPGVNDDNSEPVATTKAFRGLTNSNGDGANGRVHRFYFLGRKYDATSVDANVLDASMTVVCVER